MAEFAVGGLLFLHLQFLVTYGGPYMVDLGLTQLIVQAGAVEAGLAAAAGAVDGQVANGLGGVTVVKAFLFLQLGLEAAGADVSGPYGGGLGVVLALLGEKQVGGGRKGVAEVDTLPLAGAAEFEPSDLPDAAVGLGVAPRWQGQQGDVFPGMGDIEVVPLFGADADLGRLEIVEGNHGTLAAVVGQGAGDDHGGGRVLAQVDALGSLLWVST
ncbi:MAG: hypothetical protein P8101_19920 [Candidatus Thiodiazotropha sp.]